MERPDAASGPPSRFLSPADFWQAGEWKAVGYAQIPSGDRNFWQVVLVFETRAYAERVAAAFSAWQGARVPPLPGADQDVDEEDAIRVSFVLEDEESYTFYLYPGPDAVPEGEPSYTFAKRVPGGPEFWLARFVQAQQVSEDPYLLCFAYLDGGNPLLVQGTNPIWKARFKIKWRRDVRSDEPESHHG